MRKAPPKSHLYTVLALLIVIIAVGGVIVATIGDNSKSKSAANQPRPDSQVTERYLSELKVEKGNKSSNSTVNQNSLNPQKAGSALQPASGEELYAQYNGTQSTGQPRRNDE